MASVIERIKQTELCCGCGLCSVICPKHALTIEWNQYGEYQPTENGENCNSCGLCLRICPFANGNPNETDIGNQLYGRSPDIQHRPETGFFLSCGVGYVADETRRWQSASGGLASWFLEKLLTDNVVDAVLCVKKSADENHLYQFFIAKTPEDIRSSRGSAYYPTEMSSVLSYVLQHPGRYAVIGLPCFVKAIRLASLKNKTLKERIIVAAGLTCGQMKSTHFTDYIAYLSGQTTKPVQVSYRCKTLGKPPIQYSFRYTGIDGKDTVIANNNGISIAWGNRAFMLPTCDMCDDIFAECADITFMDAWLREYAKDPHGTSFWVARSKLAKQIMSTGITSDEISAHELSVSKIIASQLGVVEAKRKMLSYRLSFGTDIIKRVPADALAVSMFDRCVCQKKMKIAELSRRTQLSSVEDFERLRLVLEKEFKTDIITRNVLLARAALQLVNRKMRK